MTMTIKELINKLGDYPYDMQVFIDGDTDIQVVNGLADVVPVEMAKTNNNGSYDAVLIVPDIAQHRVHGE